MCVCVCVCVFICCVHTRSVRRPEVAPPVAHRGQVEYVFRKPSCLYFLSCCSSSLTLRRNFSNLSTQLATCHMIPPSGRQSLNGYFMDKRPSA